MTLSSVFPSTQTHTLMHSLLTQNWVCSIRMEKVCGPIVKGPNKRNVNLHTKYFGAVFG